MKSVCVITGGGSGIGFATAEILGRDNYVIISGRNQEKLDKSVQKLISQGIAAEAFVCDIADRVSVEKIAAHAVSHGKISAVINAAGMSPNMGDAESVMRANAIGTINVNEIFYDVMKEGSCVIDVSSMVAHITPKLLMPVGCYKYSLINREKFFGKMMNRVNLFPKKLRSSIAYAVSKNFVVWYAKTDAAKMGTKGIRVVSISPGSIETPMANLETDSHISVKYCASKRLGHPEELANLIAFCVSEKAGYLTGVDIICDGGCVASGFNPLTQK
jgi:NAD(P)-dependent dehydrogenase (short-subunit alcohol dehydrogenase family)